MSAMLSDKQEISVHMKHNTYVRQQKLLYQPNFKKIVMPRPVCGAFSVTALVDLATLTFEL